MKDTFSAQRLRSMVVVVSASLLALLAPARVKAHASSGARPVGTIIGWGTYAIDHLPVPPGALLFSGDVVSTGPDSGAELSLFSGAVAHIEAGSEVHLEAAAADLDLRQGALTLRSGTGKAARARVLGASILVGADLLPAICRLEARSASAIIAADRGIVTIEALPAPLVLAPGRIARLERASNQAATLPGARLQPARVTATRIGQAGTTSGPGAVVLPEELRAAGRVVGTYPQAEVRHPDSPIAVPLRLGELVDIGDVLGTLDGGRARVQLLDDTLFDLGISTTLSVLRHDPKKHSTELDLQGGHLHADLGARGGAQARFEVRTPIVDVTTSPTILLVSAGARQAVVCSAGAGPVSVRSVRGGAAVTLAAGQCSLTRAGEAPGPPRSDAARLEREMELATFEAGPGVPELARSLTLKQASAATNAGVALLDALLLIEADKAARGVKQPNLASVTSALNNLSNHTDSAAEAARELCLAFLSTFARVPSPSIPANQCPNPSP